MAFERPDDDLPIEFLDADDDTSAPATGSRTTPEAAGSWSPHNRRRYRRDLAAQGYTRMLRHEFEGWLESGDERGFEHEASWWCDLMSEHPPVTQALVEGLKALLGARPPMDRASSFAAYALKQGAQEAVDPVVAGDLLRGVIQGMPIGSLGDPWDSLLRAADLAGWPAQERAKAQMLLLVAQADAQASERQPWRAARLRSSFPQLASLAAEMPAQDRDEALRWLSRNLREATFTGVGDAQATLRLVAEMGAPDAEDSLVAIVQEHLRERDVVSQVMTLSAFADAYAGADQDADGPVLAGALARTLDGAQPATPGALRRHLRRRPGAQTRLKGPLRSWMEQHLPAPGQEGAPAPPRGAGARGAPAPPAAPVAPPNPPGRGKKDTKRKSIWPWRG